MGYETGYASMWRVRRIDPDTWTPVGVLDGVDSVTVQRAVNDGSSPLLESGSMEVSGDVEEGYYRIEMAPLARRDGHRGDPAVLSRRAQVVSSRVGGKAIWQVRARPGLRPNVQAGTASAHGRRWSRLVREQAA